MFRRFLCDLEDRRALCRILSEARVLLSPEVTAKRYTHTHTHTHTRTRLCSLCDGILYMYMCTCCGFSFTAEIPSCFQWYRQSFINVKCLRYPLSLSLSLSLYLYLSLPHSNLAKSFMGWEIPVQNLNLWFVVCTCEYCLLREWALLASHMIVHVLVITRRDLWVWRPFTIYVAANYSLKLLFEELLASLWAPWVKWAMVKNLPPSLWPPSAIHYYSAHTCKFTYTHTCTCTSYMYHKLECTVCFVSGYHNMWTLNFSPI